MVLNSTAILDEPISPHSKSDSILMFQESFTILSKIMQKKFENLRKDSLSLSSIDDTKGVLIQLMDLIGNLAQEIQLWDLYDLHPIFVEFLTLSMDLDYVLCLIKLTLRLLTEKKHGSKHFINILENMTEFFFFLMPLISILDSYKNNLQAISTALAVEDKTELFQIALKYSGLPSNSTFVQKLLRIFREAHAKCGTLPEQIVEIVLEDSEFMSLSFKSTIIEVTWREYYVLGLINLWKMLHSEVNLCSRDAMMSAAVVFKGILLI